MPNHLAAAFLLPVTKTESRTSMASYTEIVAAIDQAIADFTGAPVKISEPDGRSSEFTSLSELIAARKYYARLIQTQSKRRGFGFIKLIKGGMR